MELSTIMSDKKIKTHPSYGMIQVSRTSCNKPQILHGSSVENYNTVRIKISRGCVHRDYYKDMYLVDDKQKAIVELEMSEAQFANAISSVSSSVVPCTLRYVNGEQMPNPEIEAERNKIINDFEEKMKSVTNELVQKAKEIEQLLSTKTSLSKADRENIINSMRWLLREVQQNVPFIQEQFNKTVEETLEAAKLEINATMTAAMAMSNKHQDTPNN